VEREAAAALLHDQVVKAPSGDRHLSRTVGKTGEPCFHEGELIADRRDDADGLDRAKLGIAGLEPGMSAAAQEKKDGHRHTKEDGDRYPSVSTGSAHGVPIES